MTPFAAMLVYLLPGAVLALHQGIAHYSGEHVPRLWIFGWSMPHWMLYSLVVLLGPFLLVAILLQVTTGWGRS